MQQIYIVYIFILFNLNFLGRITRTQRYQLWNWTQEGMGVGQEERMGWDVFCYASRSPFWRVGAERVQQVEVCLNIWRSILLFVLPWNIKESKTHQLANPVFFTFKVSSEFEHFSPFPTLVWGPFSPGSHDHLLCRAPFLCPAPYSLFSPRQPASIILLRESQIGSPLCPEPPNGPFYSECKPKASRRLTRSCHNPSLGSSSSLSLAANCPLCLLFLESSWATIQVAGPSFPASLALNVTFSDVPSPTHLF